MKSIISNNRNLLISTSCFRVYYRQKYVSIRKPKYICLTGNSGVGKSTLLKSIGSALYSLDNYTIAIDEKAIHHPFLQSLFSDTRSYGYLIQINFMLQRALLIKAWIDTGYNLVMERSHLEDYVFIEFLYEKGYISNDDHDAYLAIWDEIKNHLPEPDIIVFMDFPVEFSLDNLVRDEMLGIRPREFPDEETKKIWISGWYKQYNEFCSKLTEKEREKVITFDPSLTCTEITNAVINKLFYK
ncbi:deoxynucleoside kinase [Photorhabdus heterorhabditis]|uniref:deoxynucleoside kinase n=1 Tax=Photorhabdus heterorhabditis TaxID=880156 RepID=UPI0020B72CE9|nr:deoxynucleoside kinase [Photorhabdus heterorhabditis]